MGDDDDDQHREGLQEVRQADAGDDGHAAGHGHRADDHAHDGRVRQGRCLGVRAAAGRSRPSSSETSRAPRRGAGPAARGALRDARGLDRDLQGGRDVRRGLDDRHATAISIPRSIVAKWDRVGAELRPKAVEAKTPGELRAVLADMLGRLGLSHFAVIPVDARQPRATTATSAAQPGFDVRLIDRQLVVIVRRSRRRRRRRRRARRMDRRRASAAARSRRCWRASPRPRRRGSRSSRPGGSRCTRLRGPSEYERRGHVRRRQPAPP